MAVFYVLNSDWITMGSCNLMLIVYVDLITID